MVIKCLIENVTDNPTLIREHGLSLYIEGHGHRVLFDLGKTGAFADNARTMGVDISAVDTVIISHGHCDHGGGLERFFELNDGATVWMSHEAFGRYHSSRPDGSMKYIGLDQGLKDHPRISFVHDRQMLGDCMELFANSSYKRPTPSMNRFLFEESDGAYVPDTFQHEINLKMTCEGKSVLIAGCAHNGIENIIDTYRMREEAVPNVVIGGFHLSSGSRKEKASESIVRQIGSHLAELNSEIYTCHCTGTGPFKLLKEEVGDRLCYLSTGRSIHL